MSTPQRIRKLVAALTLLAPAATAAETEQPLRIVTFNAEILAAPGVRAGTLQRFRFSTAREQHLERVAGIVEALQPDICNLVEVTSGEVVQHLVRILHEKGLREYRGYHVDSHDTFTGMDVGVLARIPADEVAGRTIRTIYSDRDDPAWRAKFMAPNFQGEVVEHEVSLSRNSLYYFTVNGHKLGFLGLHLKSNPQDDYSNARRTAEASIAQKIIRQEIVARGYQPIVLGDLNDYDPDVPDRDESRSPATNVLGDLKDYDRQRAGPELFNPARRIVRLSDRYTSHWDRNENGAADSDDVFTMLDYVLLPQQLDTYVQRVFIARVLDLSTSDHWPVVVDLKLPEKSP